MTKFELQSYQRLKHRLEDIQAERDALPYPSSYRAGGGSRCHDLSDKMVQLEWLDRKAQQICDQMTHIEQFIGTLPERQRQVIRTKYIDHDRELKLAEVAAAMGITVNAAQSLHARALKALK